MLTFSLCEMLIEMFSSFFSPPDAYNNKQFVERASHLPTATMNPLFQWCQLSCFHWNGEVSFGIDAPKPQPFSGLGFTFTHHVVEIVQWLLRLPSVYYSRVCLFVFYILILGKNEAQFESCSYWCSFLQHTLQKTISKKVK